MNKLNYEWIRQQLAGTSRAPLRLAVSALFFTAGYVLLLMGLARLLAFSLGWNANLLVVGLGALHIALGIIVVTVATGQAGAVDDAPFSAAETPEMALERADTLIMNHPPRHDSEAVLRPPAFPPRTRVSF